MVYINENFFDNYDVLYIVEKVLKNVIQWYYFREIKIIHTSIHIKILLFVYEFIYVYYVKSVDYYKNTSGDMRNETDFCYHCKEFDNNHNFAIFF